MEVARADSSGTREASCYAVGNLALAEVSGKLPAGSALGKLIPTMVALLSSDQVSDVQRIQLHVSFQFDILQLRRFEGPPLLSTWAAPLTKTVRKCHNRVCKSPSLPSRISTQQVIVVSRTGLAESGCGITFLYHDFSSSHLFSMAPARSGVLSVIQKHCSGMASWGTAWMPF